MTDTLGFLVADVSRLLRRRFDERARAIGATRAQWQTLTVLSRHEGINQGGLAELLEVEPITLCRMIDRLEEASLVERRRDPADRRAWRIYLTEKARPIIAQLRVMGDGLIETAFEGVSPDEREQLMTTLQRIRTNISSVPESDEAANG